MSETNSYGRYELAEPITIPIKIYGDGAGQAIALFASVKKSNAEIEEYMRMSMLNLAANLNGEPLPYPEHAAKMEAAYEKVEAQRREWDASDVVNRLRTHYFHDEEAPADEAADEIERLRAQVAELLPYAERDARRRANIHPHGNSVTREAGERMLSRISSGEFGEVTR